MERGKPKKEEVQGVQKTERRLWHRGTKPARVKAGKLQTKGTYRIGHVNLGELFWPQRSKVRRQPGFQTGESSPSPLGPGNVEFGTAGLRGKQASKNPPGEQRQKKGFGRRTNGNPGRKRSKPGREKAPGNGSWEVSKGIPRFWDTFQNRPLNENRGKRNQPPANSGFSGKRINRVRVPYRGRLIWGRQCGRANNGGFF